MTSTIILTVIGSDRPGLTGALADAVLSAGGNWLESHLSRLAGTYVGSVLVEVPDDGVAALRAAVSAVDAQGLSVAIVAAGAAETAGAELTLSIVGQDRPGIVREVSTALATLGVNIEKLTSVTEATAWSGGLLFKAEMLLRLPAGIGATAVQDALEAVSAEIMVDIAVTPA